MKLVVHKAQPGGTWKVESITGPSPSYNINATQLLDEWYFQDLTIFEALGEVHLWITPVAQAKPKLTIARVKA